MLSQERIKLMTKMAAYEENEGKKYMSIGSYFRSDYMGMQVIRSVICGTLAFFQLAGLYVYYHFETMMQDIYKMDLLLLGRRVLLYCIYSGVQRDHLCDLFFPLQQGEAKPEALLLSSEAACCDL